MTPRLPLDSACRLAVGLSAAFACLPGPGAAGQAAPAPDVERVEYAALDGTALHATLTLPDADAPVPGVVVLSIAGTDRLVDALTEVGWAVLTPERRGFVSVEPLLRATYDDLAADVASALSYLRTRPEVDEHALVLVAQDDDTPPAMIASVRAANPVPLVLLAPPAFPGVETFRREQRAQARRAGAGPDELVALDAYVERIAEIALSDLPPYAREYRLHSLRAGSAVQLPRNAAFPSDERQAHFFASPLWHDRLAFHPEGTLSGLRGPILVLIGTEDADTPLAEWLSAVRRGLAPAGSRNATICLLPGRTRHTFSDDGVEAVSVWLAEQRAVAKSVAPVQVGSGGPERTPLPGCLPDP